MSGLVIPTPVAFGGAAFTWFGAAGWAFHDLRMERDAATKAARGEGITAALDNRTDEIIALKRNLKSEIAAANPQFNTGKATAILDLFWDSTKDVHRLLHTKAPEWVDYFSENPPWFNLAVTRMRPEEFEEVVRLMDYTIDQIAHIRARLPKS